MPHTMKWYRSAGCDPGFITEQTMKWNRSHGSLLRILLPEENKFSINQHEDLIKYAAGKNGMVPVLLV